jgi:hypothetical protein
MSTRISDLPGPSINEPSPQQIQQVPQMQQYHQDSSTDVVRLPNEVLNELSNININQSGTTSPSNISMNIKKKVRFADENEEDKEDDNPNFLSFIKSQITEDNLLLLILFIVITRTELDSYLIFISPSYLANPILLNVFKAFVILIFYLIMKQYFLPKIKL